jgi:GT2 family glycosyltransferase
MYYTEPNLIWCAGVHHNFWTTHGIFIGHNELDYGQFKSPIDSDSVITAFMVRSSVASKIWFDAKTFPIGWEDMDFAMKLKRSGYSVCVLPWIKVWHDFPIARFIKNNLRLYFEVRNRIVFHRKWSASPSQYFCSVSFSVATGLVYLVLSVFCSRASLKPFKTVLTALSDGLSLNIRGIRAF